jgi:hypothetical protein
MNSNDEKQIGKRPADSLEGEQKQPSPDHIDSEREQHPHQLRHVSQEEMQKIMPPNPDPDDPQSP